VLRQRRKCFGKTFPVLTFQKLKAKATTKTSWRATLLVQSSCREPTTETASHEPTTAMLLANHGEGKPHGTFANYLVDSRFLGKKLGLITLFRIG